MRPTRAAFSPKVDHRGLNDPQKSQSSGPEADTLILGLASGPARSHVDIDNEPLSATIHALL